MLPKYEDKDIKWVSESTRFLWVKISLFLAGSKDPDGEAKELLRNHCCWTDFNSFVAESGHELDAVLRCIEPYIGIQNLHLGLTTSDVTDTALSIQLVEYRNRLSGLAGKLTGQIRRMLVMEEDTPADSRRVLMARTHGRFAEPIPWKHKLECWFWEIEDSLRRFTLTQMPVKFGGSVGCYYYRPDLYSLSLSPLSTTSCPNIEESLFIVNPSTQCVPRHFYAAFAQMLAVYSGVLARIALDIRLLLQDGVEELVYSAGHRNAGTSTSSSMPGKESRPNPVGLERVCGMARLVRGYTNSLLENVELWNERDISHSAVENVVWPDLFHVLCHQTTLLTSTLERVHVTQHPPVVPASVMAQAFMVGERVKDPTLSRAKAKAIALKKMGDAKHTVSPDLIRLIKLASHSNANPSI
jgi:adenylosuccinate lyase